MPPGISRRPRGKFQAQAWSSRDRRRVSKTFPTLAAAKAWKRDAEQAFAHGTRAAARAPRLADAAEQWLAGAEAGTVRTRSGDVYRPSTIRGYRQALTDELLPHLGHKRLTEIRRGELHRLVQQLTKAGRKPATVRNLLVPLRVIYRDAIEAEVVVSNPASDLRLPADRARRDRVVAPGDANLLLATLPERDRPLWATALFAGLRRGELMALRWENVDLANGRIRVEFAYDPVAKVVGPPKSRAGLRVVPVPSSLRDHLVAHRARAAIERQPLVFARSSLAGRRRGPDGPFSDVAVSTRARKAWGRQGVAPVTLHECRHTYASLLIAAGETPKAVQTYMGHSSIAITFDRYGHLFPASEQASAVRLQVLLDGALDEAVAAQDAAGETRAQAAAEESAQ